MSKQGGLMPKLREGIKNIEPGVMITAYDDAHKLEQTEVIDLIKHKFKKELNVDKKRGLVLNNRIEMYKKNIDGSGESPKSKPRL